MESDNAAALWNLSDLLFSTVGDVKQKDRADELLIEALRAGLPAGTQRTVGRAVAYQREGETERALRLLDGALQVLPKEPTLWLFHGRYQIDAGRCPEAIEDLQRARDLDARNPLTHGALGLARQCLGDYPGAIRDYEKALEIDPNQPEIRQYLRELGGGGPQRLLPHPGPWVAEAPRRMTGGRVSVRPKNSPPPSGDPNASPPMAAAAPGSRSR